MASDEPVFSHQMTEIVTISASATDPATNTPKKVTQDTFLAEGAETIMG